MVKILFKKFIRIFAKLLTVYGASASSLLFTIIVLPRIHSTLSASNWVGLSIFISALGFLMVLDMGVSQILPRTIVARPGIDVSHAIDYYRSISGLVAIVFGISLFLYIFLYIQPDIFRKNISAIVFGIVGCFWVALSYFNNIYISALQGLCLNVRYVQIASTVTLIRIIVIVSLIWCGTLNLNLLIFVYVFCAIVENIFYKFALAPYINFFVFDIRAGIKALSDWKFLSSAIYVSSGAWLSQLDRLISIKYLSLQDYANYILISSFCLLFLIAQYPLLRYLMPRMKEVMLIFRKHSKRIIFLYFLFGIFTIYIAPSIFAFWAGGFIDPTLNSAIRILIGGIFIHSIYNFGYQHMILDGAYKGIFFTNCLSLFLALSISFFIPKDIQLGGWIWVIFSCCQLLCLFAYRVFPPFECWCRN